MKFMNKLQDKLKKAKKDNKGFSLVELIIVIAIMAILVGIVGTQVIPYINKSKESKDFQIINSYGTAATTAYSSNAENVTAETTTIVMYGATAPAAGIETTLYDEIKSLTGYDAIDKLTDKMGSKKGKTIAAVKIVINLKDKNITTQAYSDQACTPGKEVFDKVVTQL